MSVRKKMATNLRLGGWHCCALPLGLVQRAVLDLHLQRVLPLGLLTCSPITIYWTTLMPARTRFHAMPGSLLSVLRLLSTLMWLTWGWVALIRGAASRCP